MRAEANQFKDVCVGLAIDEDEVGANVAVAVSVLVSAEGVIAKAIGQREIRSEKLQCGGKCGDEAVTMSCARLTFVVLLEASALANRPHSDRS